MKLKKLLAILMALAMAAALFTGCASKTNEDPNAGADEEDEENYETGRRLPGRSPQPGRHR